MTSFEIGADLNLSELRERLIHNVALVTACVSGTILVFIIGLWPFPLLAFTLISAVFAFCWAALRLFNERPELKARLFTLGLTGCLFIAMIAFPNTRVPFLALLLGCVSGFLVPSSPFAIAVLTAALAAGLNFSGLREYPLVELVAMLVTGAAVTRVASGTLFTALEYAWIMQRRAYKLLDDARDHQGELARALKSLEITTGVLRRAQQEVALARKHAQEAQRVKELFAANVSHELRTPLNLILGFSELMCLSSEVYGNMEWPSSLRQDVYQIYRSSRHLLEMIDDILDLSRFEIAGFTLNREPTSLSELIQDVFQMSQHLFRGRDVTLRFDVSEIVPKLDIDPTRIRQVLLNLLANAAHFTESGLVSVALRREHGEVMVSVTDTGPGIPDKDLEHLFEEFYQVDRSLQPKQKGTGLGLAISKRFVEAHDGRIWVESRPGSGSCFTFALPIPGEGVSTSKYIYREPVERETAKARPAIFVVDRDPEVANLVGRYLPEFKVLQLEEMNNIVARVLLEHPHAVIRNVPPGQVAPATWSLPAGSNGPGRITEISSQPILPLPIIECSLPSHAWLAEDLGVTACLSKPITAEKLVTEIARVGEAHEILVIDDDRGFCRLIDRIVQANCQDMIVRQAYDGEEALRMMREQRPDIVFLDLIMPGMNGFKVREAMKSYPELATVPVFLLTTSGYAQDVLAQHANQIIIHRPDGLKVVETLECLNALVNSLQPRYDENTIPETI